MKTILLFALPLAALSTMAVVSKSPELVPTDVWERIQVPDGRHTDEEIADLNRRYGRALADKRAVGTTCFIKTNALARAPMVLARNKKPGQNQPEVPDAPETPTARVKTANPANPADSSEPTEPPSPPATPARQQPINELQREADRIEQRARIAEDDALRTENRAMASINSWKGADSPGRTLIIRSTETDPKSLAAAREDLNIMARILSNAAANKDDDEEKSAMGIRILSFGGGLKNLEIEGYGAIFLLRVNFPLSGPVEKVEEEKPGAPANSTWEEAKKELYGSRESTGPRRQLGHSNPQTPEYDPKRVERFENALIESLKNAANIRALKPEEWVTIVVNSGDTSASFWDSDPSVFLGSFYNTFTLSSASDDDAPHRAPGNRSGATLTIRAKKADIDAFFHGKLTSEEFRRKTTLALY